MTERLYDKSSSIKDFTARVISCNAVSQGFEIVLDKTAFFPEAGGQKCDLGSIEQASVLGVELRENEIIHITDKPLEEGAEVKAAIDWERRFDFMQQHTGEHIVCGVAHRLYGCENVGFHLSEDIVTLDLDILLNDEQIKEVELLANRAVFENRPIRAYFPTENEVENIEFRSKKEINEALRIVEIEGVDSCACCAPHLESSAQVGLIKLLSTEKLRGGIRIEIKCGGRALSDYNVKTENAYKIAALLCAKTEEISAAVEKLMSQNDELRLKLTDVKRSILGSKIDAFNPEKEITAIFESDLTVKDLQSYADALYKKAKGIRAVFSGTEGGFLFAICGAEAELDEVFNKFKESFTVKGGGRNGMVQGTVFAEKAQIEGFFPNLS